MSPLPMGVPLPPLGLRQPLFDPSALAAFRTICEETMAPGAGAIFLKGIIGGWLIALMVWLLPGSESSRLPTIVFITYLIGIGKMSHIIAGSVETMYLAVNGIITYGNCVAGYMIPAWFGNIVGGVALVAALNQQQVPQVE